MAPRKPTTKKPVPKAQAVKQQPAGRPIRREVGAAICLFLAIFGFLALFSLDALFINFYRSLMRGLVGWGFYFVPFVLLAAAAIFAFHRGKPVRLRVASCLLLCLMLGALSELFFVSDEYGGGWEFITQLYNGVGGSAGGGLLGGLLAIGARTVFSTIGAAVILLFALLLFAYCAFKNQIVLLIKRFGDARARSRIPYEVEQEEEELPTLRQAVAAVTSSRPSVDIPVDDAEPRKRHGFFRRKEVDIEPPSVPPSEPSVEVDGLGDLGEEGFKVIEIPDKEPPPEPLIDYGRLPNEVALPVGVSESDSTRDYGRLPNEVALPTTPDTRFAERSASDNATEVFVQPTVAPRERVTPAKPQPKSKSQPQPEADLFEAPPVRVEGEYTYPPSELLELPKNVLSDDAGSEMKTNAKRLNETLASFGIDARIINITRGPSVTRYELELDAGIKLTRLTNLADDIALSLGATGVRIAPIPDKVAIVGVEVPNKVVSTVYAREILESREFVQSKSRISFTVGKSIGGDAIIGDIARMPHLLIAGTTGSGKSVCMNSLIVSLLYKSTPSEVRCIMIDPKMVELNVYNGIPHLLTPVVTDPKKASGALQWAVSEMMKRYLQFKECDVRDIFEYNEIVQRGGEVDKIPQIVIMIDELADLMLVAAKEVEGSIVRIAQLGRAAGIHLIIATQSPRADIITGLIKANIPSKIAFAVASGLESRIVLDTTGAEKLVGRGDMLYVPIGTMKPMRVQGCYISSADVEKVVRFIKKSSETAYSAEVIESMERTAAESSKGDGIADDGADGFDEMLPQAVDVIIETGQASVSMLQRRLKLGYARAARLVDQLERRGIVGPFEGAKPRALLVTREQWEEMKLNNSEYN